MSSWELTPGASLPVAAPSDVHSVLLGVLGSLGAAVMIGALHWAVNRFRDRRGELAGWWLCVTYAPKDIWMEGPIWSIELTRIRHRRGGSKVTAELWRIYSKQVSSYDRRWKMRGYWGGADLVGYYRPTGDPHGGHGALHIWRVGQARYQGQFISAVAVNVDDHVEFLRQIATTEWIALPEHEVIEMLRARIPEATVYRKIPAAARRRLWPDIIRPYQLGLAYASGPNSPLAGLEAQRAVNAQRLAKAPRNLNPLYRTDLVEDDLA
jgi:hypothetical protein